MRGWNPKILNRLPHHKRAGGVRAYGEPDLANPRAVMDAAAGVIVTEPRVAFVEDFVPRFETASPQNTGGPKWRVLWRTQPLWQFHSHAPEHEMRRLADLRGIPVKHLRLERVVEPQECGSRVAVRRSADEVAQLTARVRSLLLG